MQAAGLGELAAPHAARSASGGSRFAEPGELPMQNALLVGLSRQVALGRELDVVANTIANRNTTCCKADGALFEEFISPTARLDNFMGADKRVSFVQDRATWLDMTRCPSERTWTY